MAFDRHNGDDTRGSWVKWGARYREEESPTLLPKGVVVVSSDGLTTRSNHWWSRFFFQGALAQQPGIIA